MAYICDNCGRHSHRGRQHTHHTGVAGGQWKKRAQRTDRVFRANLHWISLPVQGSLQRMRLCTDCISRVKFDLQKLATAAVA